jgi:hypothetical protein
MRPPLGVALPLNAGQRIEDIEVQGGQVLTVTATGDTCTVEFQNADGSGLWTPFETQPLSPGETQSFTALRSGRFRLSPRGTGVYVLNTVTEAQINRGAVEFPTGAVVVNVGNSVGVGQMANDLTIWRDYQAMTYPLSPNVPTGAAWVQPTGFNALSAGRKSVTPGPVGIVYRPPLTATLTTSTAAGTKAFWAAQEDLTFDPWGGYFPYQQWYAFHRMHLLWDIGPGNVNTTADDASGLILGDVSALATSVVLPTAGGVSDDNCIALGAFWQANVFRLVCVRGDGVTGARVVDCVGGPSPAQSGLLMVRLMLEYAPGTYVRAYINGQLRAEITDPAVLPVIEGGNVLYGRGFGVFIQRGSAAGAVHSATIGVPHHEVRPWQKFGGWPPE